MGDRARGEADIRRGEELARELRQPVLEARALGLRTASALLSGRLADADVMIVALQELTERHGLSSQVPSLQYRIGYERGTLGDVEELFVALAEAYPHMPVYRTGLLGVYVTTDRPEMAREHLRALAADDWAIVPRDGLWIVTVAGAARTAGLIGELEIAAQAYDMGLAHTDWLSWTGASYEQPIAMSLAIAATGLGRHDDAEALFQKSLDLCVRAEAPTFEAATKVHWAEALEARGDAADLDRARELATSSHATAQQLGLGRVLTLSERLLERL